MLEKIVQLNEALWGSKVSASAIRELNKKAYILMEGWRNRSLQGGRYLYGYVEWV